MHLPNLWLWLVYTQDVVALAAEEDEWQDGLRGNALS
jgi:hypothetical protein